MSSALSANHMLWLMACWYLCLNLATLATYRQDKIAAQLKRWRTRESTFHWLALLGGWPAALAAQHRYRHKTRNLVFNRILRICMAVNCFAAGLLVRLIL
jgi:uncharacterized membrane protein YsdA (DUF1294 family)